MCKRQRVDDEGGDDAMDTEVDDASTNAPAIWRGVELETAVKRFLLCMYEADVKDDTETKANATSEEVEGYAEKINSSVKDKQQQQQGGRESDRHRWEIWLVGTLDENNGHLQRRGSAWATGNSSVGGLNWLTRRCLFEHLWHVFMINTHTQAAKKQNGTAP